MQEAIRILSPCSLSVKAGPVPFKKYRAFYTVSGLLALSPDIIKRVPPDPLNGREILVLLELFVLDLAQTLD
jgi:hypothetical protein